MDITLNAQKLAAFATFDVHRAALAESLKAAIPGGILGAAFSFAINYFVIGYPADPMTNGINNAVSGFMSGFMAGFIGLMIYIKKTKSQN